MAVCERCGAQGAEGDAICGGRCLSCHLATTMGPAIAEPNLPPAELPPPLERHERTFVALERRGLAVEYVGIPFHAGSTCPVCGAPLHLEWTAHDMTFACFDGCDERAIAADLGGDV